MMEILEFECLFSERFNVFGMYLKDTRKVERMAAVRVLWQNHFHEFLVVGNKDVSPVP